MVRRLETLEQLLHPLSGCETVFVTGCAAEIHALPSIMARASPAVLVSGIFIPGINRHDYSALTNGMQCETFFMTPQLQASVASGRVHYYPWRYRDVLRHYQTKQFPAAVVMLSPPDAEGYCSYGVTSDFAPLVLPCAGTRIGVINNSMPTIPGERIHLDELDFLVEIDQPLIAVPSARIDRASSKIAAFVAGFIDDGVTLQLGLGSIPGAVAVAIADRRQLKVHSGLINASILSLEDRGALCQDTPVVGGVALGDEHFYRSLHNHQNLKFRSVTTTHSVEGIAATPNFIAVNGALEVDLLGQVNSCVLSNGYVSGPGGLPEFVAGALMSQGGRSIIALNATAEAGKVSSIVPRLTGSMPSIAALDADVVVTEYGVAELRGRSLQDRIEAMLAIAAPAHREQLAKAARRHHL